MHLDLDGRVIVVTGGTSGIGLAIVRQLAAECAHPVTVARRSPEPGLLPTGVDTLTADLPDASAAAEVIDEVRARQGRLDGLVNNAALFDTRDSFTDLEDDLWERTVAVNLLAPVRLVRAAIPAMREKGGSIVHVGSEAARMPDPTLAPYAAGLVTYLLSPRAAQVTGAEWSVDGGALRQI